LQITTADSQLAVITAKRSRNRLVLLCRLPNELLVHILPLTQSPRNKTNTRHAKEIYNELWYFACNLGWERAILNYVVRKCRFHERRSFIPHITTFFLLSYNS
jgi:hypothetical protein